MAALIPKQESAYSLSNIVVYEYTKERSVVEILLYHGTMDIYADNIARSGISLQKSKPYLDFGPGFYTTPERSFAVNTAENRAKRYNKFSRIRMPRNPAIVIFECDNERLNLLSHKYFSSPSDVWGRFVLANRITNDSIRQSTEHNCDHRFDCVVGPTADGKSGAIDTLVELIDSGKVPLSKIRTYSIIPSRHLNWGIQYSFHTSAALACLKLRDVQYILPRR